MYLVSTIRLITVFLIIFAEVQELSSDHNTQFINELNAHISEMLISSDVNEKKGGCLGIRKYTINQEQYHFPIHYISTGP